MNKVFLHEGKYIAKFKNNPAIGSIKDCLVIEPSTELLLVERQDKTQDFVYRYTMLDQKMKQSTDETEKEELLKEITELQKEARTIKPIRRKTKKLKCRIIERIDKEYYEVEIVNMPKKWQIEVRSGNPDKI